MQSLVTIMLWSLLKKDFFILRKTLRYLLLFFLLYLLFGIVMNNAGLFSGVIVVVSAMLPVTALAYEEQTDWNKYARTMPLTRFMLVLEKYLLALLLLAGSLLLALLMWGCNGLLTHSFSPMDETITVLSASGCCGIWYVSLTLPAVYRFGSHISRYILLGIVAIVFAVAFLWKMVGLPIPTETTLRSAIALLPVLTGIILILSFCASYAIYRKKEF